MKLRKCRVQRDYVIRGEEGRDEMQLRERVVKSSSVDNGQAIVYVQPVEELNRDNPDKYISESRSIT